MQRRKMTFVPASSSQPTNYHPAERAKSFSTQEIVPRKITALKSKANNEPEEASTHINGSDSLDLPVSTRPPAPSHARTPRRPQSLAVRIPEARCFSLFSSRPSLLLFFSSHLSSSLGPPPSSSYRSTAIVEWLAPCCSLLCFFSLLYTTL